MAREEQVTEVREVATDDGVGVTRQRTVERDTVPTGVLAKRIVYYIMGIIIALLSIRIVLLLLAANQGNMFVDFIYALSGIFASPFFGIFSYTPAYGSSVFEISSVVAIIIYALLGWAIAKLFTLGSRRETA